MSNVDRRARDAQSVKGERLWSYVRDRNPSVVGGAVLNRELTEDMAIHIAKQKTAPAEALGMLATDARFSKSYRLKLLLCRNPKTPLRVSLSLLKFIRIFDLTDLSKNHYIPTNLRQKVEYIIKDKLKGMPLGVKIALARRANGNIAMELLDRGERKLARAALDNQMLTEGHIYRVINREEVRPVLLRMIAEHPKWSRRYPVRFALLRNFHTPLEIAEEMIEGLRTVDLQALYSDPALPAATRPFIHRELLERGASLDPPEDYTYEMERHEDEEIRHEIIDLYQPEDEEFGAADVEETMRERSGVQSRPEGAEEAVEPEAINDSLRDLEERTSELLGPDEVSEDWDYDLSAVYDDEEGDWGDSALNFPDFLPQGLKSIDDPFWSLKKYPDKNKPKKKGGEETGDG